MDREFLTFLSRAGMRSSTVPIDGRSAVYHPDPPITGRMTTKGAASSPTSGFNAEFG